MTTTIFSSVRYADNTMRFLVFLHRTRTWGAAFRHPPHMYGMIKLGQNYKLNFWMQILVFRGVRRPSATSKQINKELSRMFP